MNRKIENKKIKNKGFTRTPILASLRRVFFKNTMPNLVSGFTIVEALVAISILSISIAATFTAVQNGLGSSILAKDQTIAFYLTQEAMEYIRNVRDRNGLYSIFADSNGLAVRDWLYGLSDNAGDPCYFGNVCVLDSPADTAYVCPGGFGSCPVVRHDSVTGLYGYNPLWEPLSFRREIQFESLSVDEVEVTIALSWVTRGVNKSFTITELLLKHQ